MSDIEREAFERWYSQEGEYGGLPLDQHDEDGDYDDEFVQSMWMAWQAARAQGRDAPTDNDIPELDELCEQYNSGHIDLTSLVCRVWNTAHNGAHNGAQGGEAVGFTTERHLKQPHSCFACKRESEGEWNVALYTHPYASVPEDLTEILSCAVRGVFRECGNSYVNAWAERLLRVAAKYGAYKGEFTGTVRELAEVYEQNLTAAPSPAQSAHWAAQNPGAADQFRCEALTARGALGFSKYDPNVAPVDILEAIGQLKGQAAPGWIRCSERLPAKADADCEGKIWCGYRDKITKKVAGPWRKSVNDFLVLANQYPGSNYWQRTGLKRPNPPAEGAE